MASVTVRDIASTIVTTTDRTAGRTGTTDAVGVNDKSLEMVKGSLRQTVLFLLTSCIYRQCHHFKPRTLFTDNPQLFHCGIIQNIIRILDQHIIVDDINHIVRPPKWSAYPSGFWLIVIQSTWL